MVVSVETADGGKAGVHVEVPRRVAAKMIVEGLAKLADIATTEAFRVAAAEAKRIADEEALAAKIQFVVTPKGN